MLLRAGARVPSSLMDETHAITQPSACLSRLMRALRAPKHARGVGSLKGACRRRILKSLGTSIREKLQTLPSMDYETRQFLRFSELDDNYDDDEYDDDDGGHDEYGLAGDTTRFINGGRHATHATADARIQRGGQLRSTYAGVSGIPTTATGRSPVLAAGLKGQRQRTTSTCSQASDSSSGSSSRASAISSHQGSRSSLRRPNSSKYSISGRVKTNATSPSTPAIDYANIYRKQRSPFDSQPESKSPSVSSNASVQRVSPLRQSARLSAVGQVAPLGRKHARATPATPAQNAPIKDRTLSADNGYVSTDSESAHGDQCGGRRVGKARSAVVSLADMCGGDASDARNRALDNARTAHRNALNREADEFARKSDLNNNSSINARRNTYSSTTPQPCLTTPTRLRSGSYSSRGSTFDLDVLSPVLNVIESEESRLHYATPPHHPLHTPRPETLHIDKSSTPSPRQSTKQQQQVHQASVNVSKDWANSLRSSSARTRPTTPLGKVTPMGDITPKFGYKSGSPGGAPAAGSSRNTPTNLKTTPTIGSQRELADRLSQSARKRTTPNSTATSNSGYTPRRHVDPLSPRQPLQSTVAPQRRGQRLSGGQSSVQLSNRSKFNSESG